MPNPNDLTPAHQLLAGTAQQPQALLDAWIALNLAQPGVATDGETDLTALRGGYSEAQAKDLNTPKKRDDLAGRLTRLIEAGCKPFETNHAGLDAFDCWSWVESLDLVRALLAADPPDLVALLDRQPRTLLNAFSPTPPHVWAAWALADRGDELIEMNEHGWPWPQDILGWAHPNLVDDLLTRGAPWSANVSDLWNKRVKSGNLSMADQKEMAAQCARTFGDRLNTGGRVIENGRDLITMVRQKDNGDSLLEAVKQHATMGDWTVPVQGEAWPILGRLVSINVDRKLTRKQHAKLSLLIEREFERLAGDPKQTLGPRGPSLGAVMHVVGMHWDKVAERDHYPSWKALEPRVKAWSGEMPLAELLTCSDTLQRELLLDGQRMRSTYERINSLLFKQARDRVVGGQPEDPEVVLAVARAQDPHGGRGFWTADTLERLLGQKPRVGLLPELTYAPLLDLMSPGERVLSMTAFVAAHSYTDSKKYLAHLDAHLGDLETVDQRTSFQRLLERCTAFPEVVQLRGKAEALARAERACEANANMSATRRPRART